MERRRSLAALFGIVLTCGTVVNSIAADPPTSPQAIDDFYAALLEPSMADGHVSECERESILNIARRTLTQSQVEEIDDWITAFNDKSAPKQNPGHTHQQTRLVDNESPSGNAPTGPRSYWLLVPDETPGADASVEACCNRHTGLYDNLYLLGTLDGFKSPVDFGLNGHFSFNTGANWGLPLVEEYGIGVQLGSTVNFSSFLVPAFKSATGLHDRFQNFITVGAFQRSDWGVNWGLVFDFLFDDYYLNMELGQWRAQIGYQITCSDEIGFWGTVGDHGDSGAVNFPFATGVVKWKPIDQGNVYWRHTWPNGATTNWWCGVADTESDFVFGGEFRVPLTDYLALIGTANFFVTPSDGTTTATTGFAFYPGGGAQRANHSRFAPLLPVANNGSFVIDR